MENIECAAGSHFNSNIELRITSGSGHLGTSRVRDLIGNCHHISIKNVVFLMSFEKGIFFAQKKLKKREKIPLSFEAFSRNGGGFLRLQSFRRPFWKNDIDMIRTLLNWLKSARLLPFCFYLQKFLLQKEMNFASFLRDRASLHT